MPDCDWSLFAPLEAVHSSFSSIPKRTLLSLDFFDKLTGIPCAVMHRVFQFFAYCGMSSSNLAFEELSQSDFISKSSFFASFETSTA